MLRGGRSWPSDCALAVAARERISPHEDGSTIETDWMEALARGVDSHRGWRDRRGGVGCIGVGVRNVLVCAAEGHHSGRRAHVRPRRGCTSRFWSADRRLLNLSVDVVVSRPDGYSRRVFHPGGAVLWDSVGSPSQRVVLRAAASMADTPAAVECGRDGSAPRPEEALTAGRQRRVRRLQLFARWVGCGCSVS